MSDQTQRPLHPLLLSGFALACVGGPLALVVLLGPDAVGGPAIGSSGLVAVLGTAAFLPPLWVWWRFGGRIAGPGGLYDYMCESLGKAGRPGARRHLGLQLLPVPALNG